MIRVACAGECMVELRERPDGLMSRFWGGDTLNTAVYLARLGVAVDYVTALGDDPFSDAMLAGWQAEGVGCGHVARLPGRMPGLYVIQTDATGERRFSYWRGQAAARELFSAPEAAAAVAALEGFGLVHLSGISLSLWGAAGRARLFAALDRLRAAGGRVSFDTNFRPRGWPDRDEARAAFAEALARADIAFVSTEDTALLWGEPVPAPVSAAAARAECVVRGPDLSCAVRGPGLALSVPGAAAAAVVDTTAAGDSFAAAYLAARLAGCDPAAAASAGHRLARTVVGYPGAIIPRGAMPGAET